MPTVNFELDFSTLIGIGTVLLAFLARFLHLEFFRKRIHKMAQTIPAGFTDAVNAAFALKIQADASAATLASEQAAFAQAQAAAQAQIAAAQASLDAASTQATADAQALDIGRKQLEALEDAYLTVGGALPAGAMPVPAS